MPQASRFHCWPLTAIALAILVALPFTLASCTDRGTEFAPTTDDNTVSPRPIEQPDAEPSEPIYQAADIPIATLYYPTFGYQAHQPYEATGGLGTWGWNLYGGANHEENLPPYPFTEFTTTWPEIGFYNSQDVETIAWQLEQMQRAGIDTIVISWQGWGDSNLDGFINEDRIQLQFDRTTRLVLDYILENGLPFRFALLLEDFPDYEGFGGARNLNNDQRRMVVDRVWSDFYGPQSKYGHMALVLNENPVFFSVSRDPEPGGLPDTW